MLTTSRRVWNLLRFTGLLVLLFGLGLGGVIAGQSYQIAQFGLSPRRLEVGLPPPPLADGRAYLPVSFRTRDGLLLRAWYLAPNPSNPWTLLLAHGHAGSRRGLLPEAELLAPRGYGLLLFDFRAHGLSEGDHTSLGDLERLDVFAALDFLQAQPQTQRLGGIGFSMGAAVLGMAAVQDQRLEAVVLEAAFPSLWDEVLFRTRAFGPLSQLPALLAMRQQGLNFDIQTPLAAICHIPPRPLLLIYGAQDDAIPPGSVERMQAAAASCPPAQIWVIPSLGHQSPLQSLPQEYEQRLLELFPVGLVKPITD